MTQGSVVPLFESAISKITNAKYINAVNSATSAYIYFLLSFRFERKFYLWTSANSFCLGKLWRLLAKIDLIDIDNDDWNISIKTLENKLNGQKIIHYQKF